MMNHEATREQLDATIDPVTKIKTERWVEQVVICIVALAAAGHSAGRDRARLEAFSIEEMPTPADQKELASHLARTPTLNTLAPIPKEKEKTLNMSQLQA